MGKKKRRSEETSHAHGHRADRGAEAANVARRPAEPARPVVSVVIVTYNSVGDLPLLLTSLRQGTDDPYETIVVDNASRDGTRELLQNLTDVEVILNDENVGFARATNQGIARSRGDYLVLLNPDTVVPPGWSSRMRRHFRPGVGAVGPISNYVAGLQKYPLYARRPLPGQSSLEEIARAFAEDNRGQSQETKLLVGFCLMVPREVILRVGTLDEDLFLGNDDLEYSWRLRREGFRLLVATDTFIYHRGQASFQSEPSERTAALVQESTDCLYRKLELAFGAGRVPAPEKLWGVSWFRPSAFRHMLLPPRVEARARLLAGAGNPLPVLALCLVEGVGHVFLLGPRDGAALRGVGTTVSILEPLPCAASPVPAEASATPGDELPAWAKDLPGQRPHGSWEVAIALGLPPGLTDRSAERVLSELEWRATRQVILFLPAHPRAAAIVQARIRGVAAGTVTAPTLPTSWQAEALLGRGYDLVELPDYYGFEGDVLVATRIRDPRERDMVRNTLRSYYHPQLIRFAPGDLRPERPSAPSEHDLRVPSEVT